LSVKSRGLFFIFQSTKERTKTTALTSKTFIAFIALNKERNSKLNIICAAVFKMKKITVFSDLLLL
jgi:hypothetical protein